jgi:hypothetical protein
MKSYIILSVFVAMCGSVASGKTSARSRASGNWDQVKSLSKEDLAGCDYRIFVEDSSGTKVIKMIGTQTGKSVIPKTGASVDTGSIVFLESRSLGVGDSHEFSVGGILGDELSSSLGLSYFANKRVSLEKNCR